MKSRKLTGPYFLTSSLRWGCRLAAHFGRCRSCSVGDSVKPRTGLNAEKNRRNVLMEDIPSCLKYINKQTIHVLRLTPLFNIIIVIRGADKSLARPGRKKATATEDFDFHISYLSS